jgi:hypothetical protein
MEEIGSRIYEAARSSAVGTGDLPLAEALKADVLLVHMANGQPLPVETWRTVPHYHAAAVRLERCQVEFDDRAARAGSGGLLGTARRLEHRISLAQ